MRLVRRVVRRVLASREAVVTSCNGRLGLVVLDADVVGEGAAGEEDLVRAAELGEWARRRGNDGSRAVLRGQGRKGQQSECLDCVEV